MKLPSMLILASLLCGCGGPAENDVANLKREIRELRMDVEALKADRGKIVPSLKVERLIVRKELIVSDTGQPWEAEFEFQQIARGLSARSLQHGAGNTFTP